MSKSNIFNEAAVLRFHAETLKDEFHRYKSWENCYGAFRSITNRNVLALNLAFYLASWGMYRGSSGLLQKNSKVHEGAVDILKGYRNLRCTKENELTLERVDELLEAKNRLQVYYSGFYFNRGNQYKTITPTDTLISKIMLGSLGCTPAFDRYFITGANEIGLSLSRFNRSSVFDLIEYIEANKRAVLNCQRKINRQSEVYYPLMKVVDMHFWQIGYDRSINSKIKN